LSTLFKELKLNLKATISFLLPLKIRYFIFGFVFAFLFVFLPLQGYIWFRELPNPSLLIEKGYNRSTKIVDRNDELLYEIYVDRKYNPVELNQIPEHVIQSTLAIEDEKFYSHVGFRIDSIFRAAKETLLKR